MEKFTNTEQTRSTHYVLSFQLECSRSRGWNGSSCEVSQYALPSGHSQISYAAFVEAPITACTRRLRQHPMGMAVPLPILHPMPPLRRHNTRRLPSTRRIPILA